MKIYWKHNESTVFIFACLFDNASSSPCCRARQQHAAKKASSTSAPTSTSVSVSHNDHSNIKQDRTNGRSEPVPSVKDQYSICAKTLLHRSREESSMTSGSSPINIHKYMLIFLSLFFLFFFVFFFLSLSLSNRCAIDRCHLVSHLSTKKIISFPSFCRLFP